MQGLKVGRSLIQIRPIFIFVSLSRVPSTICLLCCTCSASYHDTLSLIEAAVIRGQKISVWVCALKEGKTCWLHQCRAGCGVA